VARRVAPVAAGRTFELTDWRRLTILAPIVESCFRRPAAADYARTLAPVDLDQVPLLELLHTLRPTLPAAMTDSLMEITAGFSRRETGPWPLIQRSNPGPRIGCPRV
jgi:hypothetical protein